MLFRSSAYAQLGQQGKGQLLVSRLLPLADQTLANPQSDGPRLQAALQAYQMVAASQPTNSRPVQGMENSLTRLLQLNPTSPELWYDLGALLSYQAKTNAAIQAVSNAVFHSAARLKQTPGSQDLRALAVTDGRFNAIRPHPDFQRAVAAQ